MRWYNAATNGNYLGSSSSGNNFSIVPSGTTTYWGETYYNPCYSTRTSVTVTVTGLLAPTSQAASPSTVACGSPTSLSATTTGGYIRWWDAATGGNYLGSSMSGANLTINPTASTTYYADAFYTPCNSPRVSVSIIVNLPAPPSLQASPSTACPGNSSNLIGTYPVGAIRWYSTSSGGITLGSSISGGNFTVLPTVTTTYYAETYATCGVSATRNSVTITVSGLPVPTAVTVNPTLITCGTSVTLSGSTTSNYINWYTTSTGGTPLGTSSTGTTLVLTPVAATTYWAEAANGTPNSGQTFNYTGSIVTWPVPSGVSSITITAAGASGVDSLAFVPAMIIAAKALRSASLSVRAAAVSSVASSAGVSSVVFSSDTSVSCS